MLTDTFSNPKLLEKQGLGTLKEIQARATLALLLVLARIDLQLLHQTGAKGSAFHIFMVKLAALHFVKCE